MTTHTQEASMAASNEELAQADLTNPDPEVHAAFVAWRDSLPAKHWARHDLSACWVGFAAATRLRETGAGETAWLIELRGNNPSWWSLTYDYEDGQGWGGIDTALRFARKEDAEAYIVHAGWTEAFPMMHYAESNCSELVLTDETQVLDSLHTLFIGDAKFSAEAVAATLTQPQADEVAEAKREAIDLLLTADDIWTDYGSGFRVHFSFGVGANMRVVERVNTARSLLAALQARSQPAKPTTPEEPTS